MHKTILTTILIIFFCALTSAYAQFGEKSFNEPDATILEIKNPFDPQLPRKEEPEQKKDDIPKPVVKPIKPVEQPIIQPPQGGPVETDIPVPERPIPSLKINGIIWNSDRPQAIINGEIFNVGDTVLEIKIKDIQKSGIIGEFYDREITLQP